MAQKKKTNTTKKDPPVITQKAFIDNASKSWEEVPIVQDPLYYAKEMYKMSRDTARYNMADRGLPTTPEIIDQYPELQGLDIIPKYYRPYTDKQTGVDRVFPSYSGEQVGAQHMLQQMNTSPFRRPEEMSLGGILGDTASMTATGSAFGPIGTMVGAGVGLAKGLFGHFGEKKAEKEARQAEEDYAKAEHAAWASRAQNSQQGYNPYAATLPYGGMVPGMNPNVELEKQETFQTPGGGVGQVDGPSHAQGGVEMNLEPGTRVWSDKLKDPTTGKTFAELSAPIMKKIAKYEKMLK